MVDHADSVNKMVYKVFTPNPAYTNVSVSSISIDPANENHILISFSNYGITSLYETKNAGSANPIWTGNEGNLPDIPVRYCMLYPGNTNMALIATDLGVWSTTSLNGSSTQWLTTNSGLANTRVQMLKFRSSDRTLAAATHGRGLFTTQLPIFGTDTIKGNSSLCLGTTSQLRSTSSGGVWSIDNSSIAKVDSTGLVTGISPGSAILYHYNSGVYSQKAITVYALPNATIGGPSSNTLYQGDYLTLFASGGGNKYLWSTGDTTQFVNIYKAGNYNVTVTNPNGCSVTSNNYSVIVLPPLNANNLKLSISSVTCKGGQDGSIIIKALKSLSYSAVITGTNTNRTISFTDSLKINQLLAGTYSVCINLTNESGFNQCFTVIITEPQDLSVYTAVDRSHSLLQLSLSGANQYSIIWNGSSIHTTLDSISLPLKNGLNSLQVSTDRFCQGVFTKQINYSAPIQPYPVPFQDKILLDFGNLKINNLEIEIYNLSNGTQVFAQSFTHTSGLIQLNTSYLSKGTYALKIKSENLDNIYKVSKL